MRQAATEAATHRLALVKVFPAQLESLTHERVKSWRCVGAHALSLPHAVNLAHSLKSRTLALRRSARSSSDEGCERLPASSSACEV